MDRSVRTMLVRVVIAALMLACAPTTPAQNEGFAASRPLTVSITRADYGSVSARTAPGASCSASAKLPSGRNSTAKGLDTHNADGSGAITWTYQTVGNTTKGTGTYTITCSAGGQTQTATAAFQVR